MREFSGASNTERARCAMERLQGNGNPILIKHRASIPKKNDLHVQALINNVASLGTHYCWKRE